MTAPIPMGTGGMQVWLHAVNLTTSALTNSLAETIAFDGQPTARSQPCTKPEH